MLSRLGSGLFASGQRLAEVAPIDVAGISSDDAAWWCGWLWFSHVLREGGWVLRMLFLLCAPALYPHPTLPRGAREGYERFTILQLPHDYAIRRPAR